MRATKDLTGMVFGHLTAIRQTRNEKGRLVWECKCDCGKTHYEVYNKLVNNKCKSCGCQRNKEIVDANTVHGLSKTRIHKEWRGIQHRCKNPSASHYENYGGRGIRVCEEWKGTEGFIRFYNWSMENGYTDEMTIDRIDNDKGYSPDNCRWVSHMENCHNRGARKGSKTNVPGVTIRELANGKVSYRVNITCNYKRMYIGNYYSLEDAIAARKEAEKKYWNK